MESGLGSIAILLCGWMGGFHVTDTDVSAFEVGMPMANRLCFQRVPIEFERVISEYKTAHASPPLVVARANAIPV